MACIFVAYGATESRVPVLEYAVERAITAGDELLVHHIQESPEDSADAIRKEVGEIIERFAADVQYEVRIDDHGVYSEDTNVSNQKRLVDAILEDDQEYAYVVMGNIERGTIEELTLSSMTEAVLETHDIPVMLVPV
ncbi:MAG: universal stress protein [Halobacteriales archaeon]